MSTFHRTIFVVLVPLPYGNRKTLPSTPELELERKRWQAFLIAVRVFVFVTVVQAIAIAAPTHWALPTILVFPQIVVARWVRYGLIFLARDRELGILKPESEQLAATGMRSAASVAAAYFDYKKSVTSPKPKTAKRAHPKKSGAAKKPKAAADVEAAEAKA